ncbi:hypothetical protein AAKU52_002067 [Pedobacter sp. CG_S7]
MIKESKKNKTVKSFTSSSSESSAKDVLRSLTMEAPRKSAEKRKEERPNYRLRLL